MRRGVMEFRPFLLSRREQEWLAAADSLRMRTLYLKEASGRSQYAWP